MKDDFKGLQSGSLCFIEDNEDDDEDEKKDGEVGNGVEDGDKLDEEEILNLEGLDGLGIRIEF